MNFQLIINLLNTILEEADTKVTKRPQFREIINHQGKEYDLTTAIVTTWFSLINDNKPDVEVDGEIVTKQEYLIPGNIQQVLNLKVIYVNREAEAMCEPLFKQTDKYPTLIKPERINFILNLLQKDKQTGEEKFTLSNFKYDKAYLDGFKGINVDGSKYIKWTGQNIDPEATYFIDNLAGKVVTNYELFPYEYYPRERGLQQWLLGKTKQI